MKEHPIGTKVRINCPSSDVHGMECTVTSGLVQHSVTLCADGVTRKNLWLQDVDIPVDDDGDEWSGIPYAYEPNELIPIYDGHEKTSWSSCVWQPNKITVC